MADGKCSECGCNRIEYVRPRYVGPGGYNIIYCKCRRCGHQWEERD